MMKINTDDSTNPLTIKTYEISGSPLGDATRFWMSGINDAYTTSPHYYNQADIDEIENHTIDIEDEQISNPFVSPSTNTVE